MKVRLYRGPADGKIVHIPDQENYWLVESLADPINYYSDDLSEIRSIKSVYRRTHHTHPDGSVYFEWDKPKRTRTGVKPKPKKIVNNTYILGSNLNTTTNTTFSLGPYSLP
jgi:hypothetical protein